MRAQLRCVLLVLVAAAMASVAVAEEPFRVVQNETFLVIFSRGSPVLQYRHDGAPYKPYVKELFTPGGVQVLRDAPADHLHHHGIMFAVAADGVTFWTETPEGGRQASRGIEPVAIKSEPHCRRISFTQNLDWMAPQAESPTLVEKRTIELTEADELTPTMVTWASVLSPGGDRESVEITGEHYYGLGCRLLQSLDGVGRFVYASGAAGPIVRGKERVTPSAWCAYVVPSEDARLTVALFDHPNNPRHPAAMFTMPEHFAYLSATLNVWKQPLKVEKEQPLSLVYGVALWDGEASREEIERTYQEWVVLSGNH